MSHPWILGGLTAQLQLKENNLTLGFRFKPAPVPTPLIPNPSPKVLPATQKSLENIGMGEIHILFRAALPCMNLHDAIRHLKLYSAFEAGKL